MRLLRPACDDPPQNTLLTQETLKFFSRNMHVCAQIDFRSSKRVSGQGTLSLETQFVGAYELIPSIQGFFNKYGAAIFM